MSIIEIYISDATLLIELHADITVKGTGLNGAFVISETILL